MMKKFFPASSPVLRLLAGAALTATGLSLMAPARADANLEPLTNILSVPGSAGLGVVTHFERSPYREAGNRYDVLPLYLYEDERFSLHANRGGVKLQEVGDERFALFIEQRLEGFPPGRLPASRAGRAVRAAGLELGRGGRGRGTVALSSAGLDRSSARMAGAGLLQDSGP